MIKNKDSVEPVKAFKVVYRKTLVYNKNLMLSYFLLEKNAEVPIHSHKEHQIGYLIKGKIKFLTENGEFIVKEGDSYVFDANEKHGALILKTPEIIDVFNL
ncbi:MAG: cupin domain-containing protein [Candidatus Thorarchaeota archaeon]